ESRVAEIEDVLLNASIITASKSTSVKLGSKVELKTGKKSVTYHVVGPVEADPLGGKISNESPIGLALMGKKIGDIATITTPKGDIKYEVVKVG
ncbi:MAG: greA, partial [Candidatus Saccharibacteria bacterium]|nr:greA [Candidatus Saccharibacteria bacterium]